MYLGNYLPYERLGYLGVMAKRNNIHPDAYKYLRVIVEKINFAEKNKKELSLEIIKGIRDLPAIALNERETDDKTLKESIEKQEYLNKIKNTTGIMTKENLKVLLQNKLTKDSSLLTQSQKDEFINQYKEISDDEYYMFLKTFDELIRHFRDITSARKLEFLINNAANKAGLYSKKRPLSNGMRIPVILISDLEESLSEYLEKLSEKYRTDTQLNDKKMPDNPVPPSNKSTNLILYKLNA